MSVGRIDPAVLRARTVDLASGPHSFVVGDHLVGRVMEVLTESSLLMAFGDRRVLAHTALPLTKGQAVAVEVTKAGPTIELRLKPDVLPDSPRSQKNYELASLLNALGQVRSPSPGVDLETARRVMELLARPDSAVLPKPDAAALLKLFQPLPAGADRQALAVALKEWLKNSGLLFESRLLHAMKASPASSSEQWLQPLASDLKAVLSRVLAALADPAGKIQAPGSQPSQAPSPEEAEETAPQRATVHERTAGPRGPQSEARTAEGRIAERGVLSPDGSRPSASRAELVEHARGIGAERLLAQTGTVATTRSESYASAIQDWMRGGGLSVEARLQALLSGVAGASPEALAQAMAPQLKVILNQLLSALPLSRATAPALAPEALTEQVLTNLLGRQVGADIAPVPGRDPSGAVTATQPAPLSALSEALVRHLPGLRDSAIDRRALSDAIQDWLKNAQALLEARVRTLGAVPPSATPDLAARTLAGDLQDLFGRLFAPPPDRAAARSPSLGPESGVRLEDGSPEPASTSEAPTTPMSGRPEWLVERLLSQQAEFAYRWVADGVMSFDVPVALPGRAGQARIRFHREPSAESDVPGPARLDLFVETDRLGPIAVTARWQVSKFDAMLVVEREGAREMLAERVAELTSPLGAIFKQVEVEVRIGRVRRPSRTSEERPEMPGGSVLSVRV